MNTSGPDRPSEDNRDGSGTTEGNPREVEGSAALSESRDDSQHLHVDLSDRHSSVPHGDSRPSADLTVITPTIDGREELLADCIASVLDQTVFVQHLIGLDVDKEGPAVARNRLVDQVETDWVLFLDDDDVIDPDFIETVQPHFKTSDLVYTWCRKNFDYPTDLPFDGPALRERNVIPVTVCLRVDAFRAVGGFSPDVAHEDWSLWLKLLDIGARFTCVPEHKWEYRRSDEGRNAENNRKLAQGKLKEV